MVLGSSFSAKAVVQNVKVGGDIEIKGIYQHAYDIYDDVSSLLDPTAPFMSPYDNNAKIHDYLTSITRLYVEASLTDNVTAMVRVINHVNSCRRCQSNINDLKPK